MTPWSVSPSAGCSNAAARAASASILHAPSSSEYSEWTWRWAQAVLIRTSPSIGGDADDFAPGAGFAPQIQPLCARLTQLCRTVSGRLSPSTAVSSACVSSNTASSMASGQTTVVVTGTPDGRIADRDRGAVPHAQARPRGCGIGRAVRERERLPRRPAGIDHCRNQRQRDLRLRTDARPAKLLETELGADERSQRLDRAPVALALREPLPDPAPERPGREQPRERRELAAHLELDLLAATGRVPQLDERLAARRGDRHAAEIVEHEVVGERQRLDERLRGQQRDGEPPGACRVALDHAPEHRRDPRPRRATRARRRPPPARRARGSARPRGASTEPPRAARPRSDSGPATGSATWVGGRLLVRAGRSLASSMSRSRASSSRDPASVAGAGRAATNVRSASSSVWAPLLVPLSPATRVRSARATAACCSASSTDVATALARGATRGSARARQATRTAPPRARCARAARGRAPPGARRGASAQRGQPAARRGSRAARLRRRR